MTIPNGEHAAAISDALSDNPSFGSVTRAIELNRDALNSAQYTHTDEWDDLVEDAYSDLLERGS